MAAVPPCLSPSLDCFCQKSPEVSIDMTTTSTCCPLLALFVQTPLCLRPTLLDPDSVPCTLPGKNSAGGGSSPSVVKSFSRRIQSFHASTEYSKPFRPSCCLVSADGSLGPCKSTSSKYCCILLLSCRCFYDSPCTTGIKT